MDLEGYCGKPGWNSLHGLTLHLAVPLVFGVYQLHIIPIKRYVKYFGLSRVTLRPKKTWKRTVEEEARDQGKRWQELKALAKNKVRWRSFAKALRST
jgi:hypothetical protein